MKTRKLTLLTATSFLFSLATAQAAEALTEQLAFAACPASAFVAIDGPQKVSIAGRAYAPKCLRVKAGTAVTFDATSNHPLQGAGGAENPLFDDLGGAVSPKTVTFSKPGVYGYYCMSHGDDQGNGMAGAVLVE